MRKIKNKLQDIHIRKIKKYVKQNEQIIDKQQFIENFIEICLKETKNIKDCSEKSIVATYLDTLDKLIAEGLIINGEGYDILQKKARLSLSKQYTSRLSKESDIVEIYFNDVKKEYIKTPMNESQDLEFLPENRDTFIKNNLKLVIDVAKRYSFNKNSITFEDLIQIGNEGLCVAFERYDQERANLRISIINDIKALHSVPISVETAEQIIKKNFVYSNNLTETIDKIPQNGFETKDDFINWTKKHIKTAVFASVAFQWIRAYIMNEINKYGEIVRFPKKTKKKSDDTDLYLDNDDFDGDLKDVDFDDLNLESESNASKIIYLDSINNYTQDCYHDNQIQDIANENFLVEDEAINKVNQENVYTNIVESLLSVLNATEKRIVKKRFGIGYPYQLTPMEIAEIEGCSTNKVKYLLTVSLKKLQNSITPSKRKYITNMMSDF